MIENFHNKKRKVSQPTRFPNVNSLTVASGVAVGYIAYDLSKGGSIQFLGKDKDVDFTISRDTKKVGQ